MVRCVFTIYFSQNAIFHALLKNEFACWLQKVHVIETDKSHDIMWLWLEGEKVRERRCLITREKKLSYCFSLGFVERKGKEVKREKANQKNQVWFFTFYIGIPWYHGIWEKKWKKKCWPESSNSSDVFWISIMKLEKPDLRWISMPKPYYKYNETYINNKKTL